jgi:hypothetical protein
MGRLLKIAILGIAAHAGAAYLFRQQRTRYAGRRRHFVVVQGGAQLRPTGDEIQDAVVSVMMGGLVLDLRETELSRNPARLDILALMGGVELVIPESWKVSIDVHPTMGGIRDARAGRIDPERPVDLVLSGRVVMGGLDLSSTMPGDRDRRLMPNAAA